MSYIPKKAPKDIKLTTMVTGRDWRMLQELAALQDVSGAQVVRRLIRAAHARIGRRPEPEADE